jgi:hypothetical protein
MYSGQPFLANRRLFAMADVGIPDGIKCDTEGNVYSGCGDGLNIWSPGGILLATTSYKSQRRITRSLRGARRVRRASRCDIRLILNFHRF